jgi:pimeloyl-ACP methyl ester carboxylesterase
VTTADEAGVDDVAFLRATIDWSAGQHGTWPDRAVVAGVSNGAFMAHRLALEASDQVAVLAAVAGGLPVSLHDIEPAHAVSALLIHGTADTTSPIGGGFSRHLGPNGELRGRSYRWTKRRAAGAPSTDARRTAPGSAGHGLSRTSLTVVATPGPTTPPRKSAGSRDRRSGMRKRAESHNYGGAWTRTTLVMRSNQATSATACANWAA